MDGSACSYVGTPGVITQEVATELPGPLSARAQPIAHERIVVLGVNDRPHQRYVEDSRFGQVNEAGAYDMPY
jgi:hypothetical protein